MSTILAIDAAHGTSKAHHKVSAATTNSTLVKAGSTALVLAVLSNASAAAKYVKFYDKATAPAVGTDTPKMTVLVPAGQSVNLRGPVGLRFSAGLGYGMTGALPDADTTALAVADVSVDLWYE